MFVLVLLPAAWAGTAATEQEHKFVCVAYSLHSIVCMMVGTIGEISLL